MAKADLIKDAQARGLALTGRESVAELEAMLAAAGESESEIDTEAADAELVEATQAVTDAKAALDDALHTYEDAVASRAALEKSRQPTPDPAIHIFLEGAEGRHTLIEYADAAAKPTRIVIGGKNFEHVSDGENGVWVYRRM